MSIVSISSAKSAFGNSQVPTSADHTALIDTMVRDPLVAIASAGEAGRTGFVVLISSTEATVAGGTVGLPFVATENVTARRQLIANSFGVTFMDAETTAAGQSLLNIASDTTNPALNDFTNVSAVGGSAQSLVLQGATWTAATAQSVTANGIITDASINVVEVSGRQWSYVVWPGSVVEFWARNLFLNTNTAKSFSIPSEIGVSAVWNVVCVGEHVGTDGDDIYLGGFSNSSIQIHNRKTNSNIYIEGVGDKV